MIKNADFKILVADDQPDARDMTLEYLKTLGYENLVVVTNGMDALRKLEEDPTICNHRLPHRREQRP